MDHGGRWSNLGYIVSAKTAGFTHKTLSQKEEKGDEEEEEAEEEEGDEEQEEEKENKV